MCAYTSRSIADLQCGDHLCCFYDNEEEHRALLTLFLRQGLERGERVLYVADDYPAEIVLGYLRDNGLQPEPYFASGQCSIRTADSHAGDGDFDPDNVIALLRTETALALAQGYPALRVVGEASWMLRGRGGSQRLIECEAKVNTFFPGSKCLAICQYDRRRFDPAVLLDVVATHPVVGVGTTLYENSFHISADEFLGPDRHGAMLRKWLEHLAERRRVDEFREEYLSLISHDLRTPLTNVLGRADWLRLTLAQQGLASQARDAEVMLRNAMRMNAMIQDLVESARLELGQLGLQKEPTDLVYLASELVERVGTAKDRVRMRVEAPEYVPPVLADPERIERAITNLLTNALKYSPSDSPVVIRVVQQDGQAIASVTDQGVGIPAEDIPHLFERYYRARMGKKTEGVGLGLYITRMIVEAHGGRIWVESEVGRGSTFYLTLRAA